SRRDVSQGISKARNTFSTPTAQKKLLKSDNPERGTTAEVATQGTCVVTGVTQEIRTRPMAHYWCENQMQPISKRHATSVAQNAIGTIFATPPAPILPLKSENP